MTKAAMKKSTCILVRPACRQQIASSAWAGRSGSFRPFRFRWFERRDFLLEPQQSGFGGDLIAPLTCRRVVAPAFQAAACPYFSGRYVTLRCRGDARDAYCIKLAAVSDVRMQCETRQSPHDDFRVRPKSHIDRPVFEGDQSRITRRCDRRPLARRQVSAEMRGGACCAGPRVAELRAAASYPTRCSRDAAARGLRRENGLWRLDRWRCAHLRRSVEQPSAYVARARVQIGYREAEAPRRRTQWGRLRIAAS